MRFWKHQKNISPVYHYLFVRNTNLKCFHGLSTDKNITERFDTTLTENIWQQGSRNDFLCCLSISRGFLRASLEISTDFLERFSVRDPSGSYSAELEVLRLNFSKIKLN